MATPRVIYVVLSSRDPNATLSSLGVPEPSMRIRALMRGWFGRVPPSDTLVHFSNRTLQRASLAGGLSGSLNGELMFDALRAARARRGEAAWYMIGDDDTHVDPAAVDHFVRRADPWSAYGNLYHNVSGPGNPKPTCRSAAGGKFRLVHSWYTGGSGVLVSGHVAGRLTANVSAIHAWAGLSGSWCNCFDVPFACALSDLGVAVRHAPSLFLDSCLTCADFLPTASRTILSCHAVSAYRSYNLHAKRKGPRDQVHLDGIVKLRHRRGYHWPANLTHVEPIDRMEACVRGGARQRRLRTHTRTILTFVTVMCHACRCLDSRATSDVLLACVLARRVRTSLCAPRPALVASGARARGGV